MVSIFAQEYRYIEEQVSLIDDLPYIGDLFLESLSPAKKEKVNENLGTVGKIGESIRKIITGILKLIEKIIKSILNYGDYLLLPKEEKDTFNRYCAYIDSHSGLKKERITVRDWKKIDQAYSNAGKKAEQITQKAIKENKSTEEVNKEFSDLFNDVMTVVNSATVVVTADMAKSLATASREDAKTIQTILMADKKFLENMDATLGEGSSDKLIKKINKMSNHTLYRKFMVMLNGNKKSTLEKYMKEITNSLGNLDTPDGKIKFVTNNPGLVADAAKTVKNKEFRDAIKRIKGN